MMAARSTTGASSRQARMSLRFLARLVSRAYRAARLAFLMTMFASPSVVYLCLTCRERVMQGIVSLLDDASAQATRALWAELEREHGLREAAQSAPYPHVSFHLAED